MTPATVAEAFEYQAVACGSLGSPFMEQLCRLFAVRDWPNTATRDMVFRWQGDLSPRGESVPLRLAGGLHALYLKGLAFDGAYPPAVVGNDDLWDAVREAMITHDAFLTNWMQSAPQTNEVRRAAAILSAGHVVAERFGLPLRTSELGASGGLNLKWDHYGLRIGDRVWGRDNTLVLTPDWSGPTPPMTVPEVADRRGVDLNPLDPTQAEDALRLRAYLWPDQPDRLTRTKAAIEIAEAQVDRADAIDWLAPRLAPQPGLCHMIYHTIAWQYFPQAKQDEGTTLIEAAGALATKQAPLAWFSMENDGGTRGAAMTLRLWPGDVTLDLGRADFHGRWIEWSGAC